MTMIPTLLGHPANRRALYAVTLAHFPQHDYFDQYIRAIHEHRQRHIAPLVADLVWKLPRSFSSIFDIPAEIEELIFKCQGKHIRERRPEEAYRILEAIPEATSHILDNVPAKTALSTRSSANAGMNACSLSASFYMVRITLLQRKARFAARQHTS